MDAARRGHHPGFWLVLTFVTGVFGLAAYVVVVLTFGSESDAPDDEAEARETVRVCPDCLARAPDSQQFCGECGTELGPHNKHLVARRLETGSRWYCGNCSAWIGREVDPCPQCGVVF
jgi:RNA polymerase subunit RPABC4/transcription elongation factor Spt4